MSPFNDGRRALPDERSPSRATGWRSRSRSTARATAPFTAVGDAARRLPADAADAARASPLGIRWHRSSVRCAIRRQGLKLARDGSADGAAGPSTGRARRPHRPRDGGDHVHHAVATRRDCVSRSLGPTSPACPTSPSYRAIVAHAVRPAAVAPACSPAAAADRRSATGDRRGRRARRDGPASRRRASRPACRTTG